MRLCELPQIPRHYPDCCLSLSTKLLQSVTDELDCLPGSSLILSIGSGTGILEYLLSQLLATSFPMISIEGVEVLNARSQPVNIYLPEESYSTVQGTWDLSSRAVEAGALLFVYPRDPGLVARYVDAASKASSSVRVIVWLGPKVDWQDFKPCFEGAGTSFESARIINDPGIVEYEMMAVSTRRDSIT